MNAFYSINWLIHYLKQCLNNWHVFKSLLVWRKWKALRFLSNHHKVVVGGVTFQTVIYMISTYAKSGSDPVSDTWNGYGDDLIGELLLSNSRCRGLLRTAIMKGQLLVKLKLFIDCSMAHMPNWCLHKESVLLYYQSFKWQNNSHLLDVLLIMKTDKMYRCHTFTCMHVSDVLIQSDFQYV